MSSAANHAATRLVIQSRDSKLALAQTQIVQQAVQSCFPGVEITVQSGKSLGDKVLNVPLAKIGEKGLFTKELEEALLSGRADMAVHSLKDVPTDMPAGLCLGAILERHDPRDALVMRSDLQHLRLNTLPAGAVVGTSSLRRRALLAHHFPHLVFKDVRGNVQTRLAKLEDMSNSYSALVLAVSGLERLGLGHYITEVLASSEVRWYGYAVGQGALAVQCRQGDSRTMQFLQHLHHEKTAQRCIAERALMSELEGGCHAPIAVETSIVPGTDVQPQLHLCMTAALYSLNGRLCFQKSMSRPAAEAESLGRAVAQAIRETDGAEDILNRLRADRAATVEEYQRGLALALGQTEC